MSGLGRFTDKVALVTGASRGIGFAIAAQLVAEGARVVMAAKTPEPLERAGREAGGIAFPVDLTQEGAPEALVAETAARFGRLDILINNAGIIFQKTMDEATLDEFDAMYRANVRAPYALTKAALPHLRAARGAVCFVNSRVTVAASTAGRGQFAAMQFALRAVADSLRDEVNADGVRVTTIYPGATATPRQADMHGENGRAYKPERLLQPGDVAQAVCDALAASSTAEITDLYLRPMLKS